MNRCDRAGFTLLEMVIAMALLSLFLALALQLWLESARIFAASAVRARDPLLELATRRLRLDLELAVAVPGPLGLWQRDSLVLQLADGPVAWILDDDRLVRSWAAPGEEEAHRAELAAGVVRFRWRRPSPQLVEVEIGVFRDADAMLTAATRPLPRPPDLEPWRVSLLVRPRGGGTGSRY